MLGAESDRLCAQIASLDTLALSSGDLLAWRNAERLAHARMHVAEIRASQRRVVAAADAERRRIERDLHDGAQQRLVGVLMQLPRRLGLPRAGDADRRRGIGGGYGRRRRGSDR